MSSEKQSSSSGIVDTLKTLLIAGAIALGFRSLVAEPFNIPSGSMIPSLLVGDYLFVTKYSYGYSRYSFPFGLGFFSGRILDGAPERGDVAVFRQPPLNKVDFIKRLVGMPGERIQMRDGLLYINETPVQVQPDGTFVETYAQQGPARSWPS